MTNEVKSAFHWREHPSELAHYFRKETANKKRGEAARKVASPVSLPGSSVELPLKWQKRRNDALEDNK